jgi:hypothetical protein
MVPPQLVEKWAREAFRTLPRVRVFLIDGLRTQTSSACRTGVNEVKLRNGKIVREGLHASLTDLRLRKSYRTARERWDSLCNSPALFIVGRDRGKLSYFWRHAFTQAKCGRYQGSVTNPDSGTPVYSRILEAIGGAGSGEDPTQISPVRNGPSSAVHVHREVKYTIRPIAAKIGIPGSTFG